MITLTILLIVPLIGCIIASRHNEELMAYEQSLHEADTSGLTDKQVRIMIRMALLISVVVFVLMWWVIIPVAILRKM